VNPGWPLSVRSEDPAGIGENIRDASDLWEEVFSRQNLMSR
jgi:RNA-directed DNA polymerase